MKKKNFIILSVILVIVIGICVAKLYVSYNNLIDISKSESENNNYNAYVENVKSYKEEKSLKDCHYKQS